MLAKSSRKQVSVSRVVPSSSAGCCDSYIKKRRTNHGELKTLVIYMGWRKCPSRCGYLQALPALQFPKWKLTSMFEVTLRLIPCRNKGHIDPIVAILERVRWEGAATTILKHAPTASYVQMTTV